MSHIFSVILYNCFTYSKQQTQVSLTNHATSLEVSQGHPTWYHSIC